MQGRTITTGGFYWRKSHTVTLVETLEVAEESKRRALASSKNKIYVYSKESHLPAREPYKSQADCARDLNVSATLVRWYATGKILPPKDVYYSYDAPVPPEEQEEKFNELFPNLPPRRVQRDKLVKTQVVMIDRNTFAALRTFTVEEACDFLNQTRHSL